jgi:ArsR family transcriptional regulator, lead/cadmium/zinc/bismuth-responsive transcriptional repressor
MDEALQRLAAIEPGVLARASRVIRVVGHPLRLRLLELLEGDERNVTDLVQATGLAQATVSQQLKILRAEGVVGDRREGARVFYRITEPKVSRILDCIRECDLAELSGLSGATAGPDLRVLPAPSPRGQGSRRRRPATR